MDGRPEVQEFAGDEFLYRRVSAECFDGKRPLPGAFSFQRCDAATDSLVRPTISLNRGRFSEPGCALCRRVCPREHQNYRVVKFTVADLMLFNECIGVPHRTDIAEHRVLLRHEIVTVERRRGNYAHSAVRIKHGKVEVEPGADIEMFENALTLYLSYKSSSVSETWDCSNPEWHDHIASKGSSNTSRTS